MQEDKASSLYTLLFHPDVGPQIIKSMHVDTKDDVRLVNKASCSAIDKTVTYVDHPFGLNFFSLKRPIGRNKTNPFADLNGLVRAKWSSLETLNLTSANISPKDLELLTNGAWPNLRGLGLQLNKGDAETARLLASTCWNNIEEFVILQSIGAFVVGVDNEALHISEMHGFLSTLFKISKWPLRRLAVRRTDISDDAVDSLVENNSFKLERLELQVVPSLTANKLEKMLEKADWSGKSLRQLHLTGMKIGKKEAEVFVKHSPNMAALEELNLRYDDLTKAGGRELTEAQFPALKVLGLRSKHRRERRNEPLPTASLEEQVQKMDIGGGIDTKMALKLEKIASSGIKVLPGIDLVAEDLEENENRIKYRG